MVCRTNTTYHYPTIYEINSSGVPTLFNTAMGTGTIDGSVLSLYTYYNPGSSSNWQITVTFKKSGYYRIQASSTASSAWVYKAANSTQVFNPENKLVINVFYWDDLQQH